jgi:cellulose synthase (UDP-forming)
MADDRSFHRRVVVFRILGALTVALGLGYLAWRYTSSLNRAALWFAIPLVVAETYGFLNTVLFVFMMWRPTRRTPPPPLEDRTVDVFITTYNEPVELVRLTVEAALRIEWPRLRVHVLDDGARPQMQAVAAELGSGYITRGGEWTGKPRHAKAGNVNNALMSTDGEFILILDADQIPDRRIVQRTIGYFRDPRLAFVQTPQHFYNVPPGDPFGADAPLFYGPIMQGKDGWDAAFFCGSNALLRREALLQLGVTEYVRDMEKHFRRALDKLSHDAATLRSRNVPAARALGGALRSARQALQAGAPLERVSRIVRRGIASAQDLSVHPDVLAMACAVECMSELNLTVPGEAQPVLPLATISVTEDMATAMRLHALGWKSVFHTEVLAYGLAPEDLQSALSQRLRWAEGTLQVLVRENPLFKRGLSLPQRIQYFTTTVSYFDGFASLALILSPILSLVTGLSPIRTPWLTLLAWLGPYLAMNRLLYFYVTHGIQVRRSEQFSLALFPLWIKAVLSTLTGRKLQFVVTPKRRQTGNHLRLVWPQLTVIAVTALAICYGVYALVFHSQGTPAGVAINVFWGIYGIAMLLPIVRAAVFEPPEGWAPRPPDFLLARS